jgi:hypothetical protein
MTHIDVLNEHTKGVEEKREQEKERERLRKKKEDEERKRQQRQREQLHLEQAHTLLVPNAPPEITLSTSVTSVIEVYQEWYCKSAVGDGKPLQHYFLLAPPGGKGPSLHYIHNKHIEAGFSKAQKAWSRHRRLMFLAIAYEVSYYSCCSLPPSLPPSLPLSQYIHTSPSLLSSPKESDNKQLIYEEMLFEAPLALFLKWTLIPPPSFPPNLSPSF